MITMDNDSIIFTMWITHYGNIYVYRSSRNRSENSTTRWLARVVESTLNRTWLATGCLPRYSYSRAGVWHFTRSFDVRSGKAWRALWRATDRFNSSAACIYQQVHKISRDPDKRLPRNYNCNLLTLGRESVSTVQLTRSFARTNIFITILGKSPKEK